MARTQSTAPSIDDHARRAHPGSRGSIFASFVHALHGVLHVVKHERNARIALLFAVLAILLGFLLELSNSELAAVFFAIILVFIAEIFNTAIERTVDLIDITVNPHIKIIKDMAAGAVLIAAAAAAAIGLVIFMPYVMRSIWGS